MNTRAQTIAIMVILAQRLVDIIAELEARKQLIINRE